MKQAIVDKQEIVPKVKFDFLLWFFDFKNCYTDMLDLGLQKGLLTSWMTNLNMKAIIHIFLRIITGDVYN